MTSNTLLLVKNTEKDRKMTNIFDHLDGLVEEEDLSPDYVAEQVICQVRKIVDSIGNPTQLHWVQTGADRKGGKLWIGHKNAQLLLNLFDKCTNRAAKEMGYVSNRQRPEMIAAQTRAKAQLTEKLQTVKGLKELIVFVKDHKEALSV